MTFYDEIERYRSLDLTGMTEGFIPIHIEQILAKSEIHWQEFLGLLSPAATGLLENMAQAAHKLTIKHFGRTILLYTPCIFPTTVLINAFIAVSTWQTISRGAN